MVSNKLGYQPDIAIPPGWTVKETIDELGLTQAELARRAGRPLKTINEIVRGKAAITHDTAIEFERVLGVPARFWNNLERNYRETQARLRAEASINEESKRVGDFPYAEMAKNGWVKQTRAARERATELLQFFGVASLTRVALPPVSFRVGKSRREPSEHALAAWLRKGELKAQRIETAPYDASGFVDALQSVRALTRTPIESSQHELRDRCARCGVAVVIVPHLSRTYANGATRWLTPSKAIIQLSLRYSYDDIFWFNFYHEAGHILKHGKRELFIEWEAVAHTIEEIEANEFAANTLIPPDEYAEFTFVDSFNPSRVRRFAAEIGIATSIVVGRLQHDEFVPRKDLNGLRTRLEWAKSSSVQ